VPALESNQGYTRRGSWLGTSSGVANLASNRQSGDIRGHFERFDHFTDRFAKRFGKCRWGFDVDRARALAG
jgi:hypothetical protein